MTNTTHPTREAWLMAAVERLRPAFSGAGFALPDKVRCTCGWPTRGALSRTRKVLGECASHTISDDGTTEISVSPVLGTGSEALPVLVHELCHAAVGLEEKHRGLFIKCAKKVGLEGPWKSTTAGADLMVRLNALADDLGAYPHAAIRPSEKEKTQGTRMLKVVCSCCGWTCRTTAKWIEVGLPACPSGTVMDVVAVADPDEGEDGDGD